MRELKLDSKISAFRRSVAEIKNMYLKLNNAYTSCHISMLKHKSDMSV